MESFLPKNLLPSEIFSCCGGWSSADNQNGEDLKKFEFNPRTASTSDCPSPMRPASTLSWPDSSSQPDSSHPTSLNGAIREDDESTDSQPECPVEPNPSIPRTTPFRAASGLSDEPMEREVEGGILQIQPHVEADGSHVCCKYLTPTDLDVDSIFNRHFACMGWEENFHGHFAGGCVIETKFIRVLADDSLVKLSCGEVSGFAIKLDQKKPSIPEKASNEKKKKKSPPKVLAATLLTNREARSNFKDGAFEIAVRCVHTDSQNKSTILPRPDVYEFYDGRLYKLQDKIKITPPQNDKDTDSWTFYVWMRKKLVIAPRREKAQKAANNDQATSSENAINHEKATDHSAMYNPEAQDFRPNTA